MMKSRFVSIVIFLTLVISIFLAINVSAHPASDMSVSYDDETQEIEVLIAHSVSNKETHYISDVVISKNGEVYNSYNYTSQPTNSSFTYTYEITATAGDEIEVFTECNLGGTLTKQLTITSNGSSNSDDSFSIQDITYYSILGIPFIVHLGIITLVVFIVTALLPLLKKWKIAKVHVKWHIRLAIIAIILAIIHGILGFLMYI